MFWQNACTFPIHKQSMLSFFVRVYSKTKIPRSVLNVGQSVQQELGLSLLIW